jgi:transposase
MKITKRQQDPQRTLDQFGDGLRIIPFDWSTYNNSQAKEKILFLKLLNELCNLTDGKAYIRNGRKPQLASHMIFCMCLKVYLGTSSRRLISDLELCKRNYYIDSTPHFNSVSNYFNSSIIKHHLQYLIGLSALPLAQLEDKFAIDSTGFSERKYLEKWSTIRQNFSKHQQYKKAHCIYGVYSNVIPSVIVTEGTANDSPYFKQLLNNASKNFDIKDITADMAYSSRENLDYANELGITPYIPFKKNAVGKSKGAVMWNRMYRHFKDNKEEFMKHYHVRSNAESGFFMIKQKFGDSVSYKIPLAQTNEILCKILCHNICVLIQEMFLSKLDIDFYSCAGKYVAQQYS